MQVGVLVSAREPSWLRSDFRAVERDLPVATGRVDAEAATEAQVVLVLSDDLRLPDLSRQLSRIVRGARHPYVILISWDRPETVRSLLGIRLDHVILMPTERTTVGPVVRRLLTRAERLEASPLLADLRGVLGLGLRHLARHSTVAGPEPPPRSITALADAIGCSRPHLTSVARREGYDMPHLIDLFRTRWALHRARDLDADIVDLAGALGFTTGGRGVGGLVGRALGMGLRELRTHGLTWAAERTRDEIRQILERSAG